MTIVGSSIVEKNENSMGCVGRPGMVEQTFHPRTQEAEAGRSLSIPGQPVERDCVSKNKVKKKFKEEGRDMRETRKGEWGEHDRNTICVC